MKRTRSRFSYLRLTLSALLLLFLWFTLFNLAWRVSATRAADYRGRIGPDVEAQLAFIRTQLRRLDGPALEQLGPVKAVFVHTFYGFSLVNTVLLDPDNPARRAEAIRELKWLLERLRHPAIRQSFPPTQIPGGVFYLGQRNLTLAGLLLIDPQPDPAYEQEFHANSRLLYEAFMASPSAHLETWAGGTWPADNVPALYSLVQHDRLYGTTYRAAAGRWVEKMAATLDPETGLMISRVDYATGKVLDLPRGCALSFTFAFLPDFAPDFARTQYAAYRQHFFKTTLGFAGIREYPPGRQRGADSDSGLIFREVGAAATGIGIAGTKAMGDAATFESIVQLSEIIGLPLRWNGQKAYLFGQLLIGDVFEAWGKTITPWTAPGETPAPSPWPPIPSLSLGSFYGIAAGVVGLLLWLTLSFIRVVYSGGMPHRRIVPSDEAVASKAPLDENSR